MKEGKQRAEKWSNEMEAEEVWKDQRTPKYISLVSVTHTSMNFPCAHLIEL